MYEIRHGDCLAVLKEMPDNSVDLIATDPPYFRVKSEAWDRAWDDAEKFLHWMGEIAAEWQRILKPNGSLYCFASPDMSARVEVTLRQRFSVLNRIRWRKEAGWHNKARKEDLRAFLSPHEEIIFAEHYGADNMAKGEAGYVAKCDELRGFVFEPLRAYLAGERDRAGLENSHINAAWCEWKRVGCTSQTQKWFSNSCFNPPTEEAYTWLRSLTDGRCFLRTYEDLRREYEDLRREYDDLRRPFYADASRPYTDVWDFPTVKPYRGKHVCEKPVALMEHIILTSSRPGAVVLDCFAGSASTGVAAVRHGRNFIGVEKDEVWVARGISRLAAEAHQLPLMAAE